MRKILKNLSFVLLVTPASFLASCGEKVESQVLDQHVLYQNFTQENNKIKINFKSCYDLHKISYEYSLFGERNKLLGIYKEDQEVEAKKNEAYTLECKQEIAEEVSLVRFRILKDTFTYDKVDNLHVIPNKVYYYDYLTVYNSDFRIYFTENVQPKKYPKEVINVSNLGAYKFSYWSYDIYGEEKFEYDVLGSKNMLIYPNYTFSEFDYDAILNGNKCVVACAEITRNFYNGSITDDDAVTQKGYGILYKDDGYGTFYVLTTAKFAEPNTSFTNTVNQITIKGETYDYNVNKYLPEDDVAVLTFSSTKKLKDYECKFAASSYVNSKTDKIALIEAPFVKKTSRFVYGKYSGHEDTSLSDTLSLNLLRYECELGEDAEGLPIFDCEGNLIGINTQKYNNGTGYAVSVETIREAIVYKDN